MTFEIIGLHGTPFDHVEAVDADEALDVWANSEFGKPYDDAIADRDTVGARAEPRIY